MRERLRRVMPLAAALLLCAGTARAQHGYAFLSADHATDSLSLFTVGGAVLRGGAGWSPVGTVMASRLAYPAGPGNTETIRSLSGGGGARFEGARGSAQLTLTYGVRSGGNPTAREGVNAGFSTTLLADLLPTRRSLAQAITSYNWLDRYQWTRVRATHAVGKSYVMPTRIGLEATVQGNVAGPRDSSYRSLSLAPMIQLALGRVALGSLSVGPRRVWHGAQPPADVWAGHLELVLVR